MPRKTISIPEEVYIELKSLKRDTESFPDLIKRLVKKGKDQARGLEDLAGSLQDDDEWDQILIDIYENRKKPARLSRARAHGCPRHRLARCVPAREG